MATDLAALWDFDDAAGSEQRFREAASRATDPVEAVVLTTQVARALGLQGQYDAAHELLDTLPTDDDEVAVRVLLERGRLRRSAGDVEAARPLFEAAATAAGEELDVLGVDALHMVALAAPADEQPTLTRAALARARSSSDPAARAWEPSLLHNLGMTHADAGDWGEALAAFEEALAGREQQGDVGTTRVARWMVAWTLRHLGRTDEALAGQRSLKAELDAAGEVDPYVDEELALLAGGG